MHNRATDPPFVGPFARLQSGGRAADDSAEAPDEPSEAPRAVFRSALDLLQRTPPVAVLRWWRVD